MKSLVVLVVFLCLTTLPIAALAQNSVVPEGGVGIEENLGDYVPLDLGFVDADGDSIYLRDTLERPTIIALVYYHCPTICKPFLGGVSEVVEKTNLQVGEDYDILTISFDEYDTPESAAEIRTAFAEPLGHAGDGGWRFLTADSLTIAKFTSAVGFHFQRNDADFGHGSGLIFLDAEGQIVRYLYGMRFMPFDVKMAVREANAGKISPTVARVLQYCFSYDPDGRRYVFNVNRVAGAGIIFLAVGWVVYISTVGRARKKRSQAYRKVDNG